ncbi:laccase, multicopper oxidase, benzenediol:oxygen oxidorectuctase [Marasmius tenuissimus]|nr:laccase, multicopper oxidase, benzenediol:oxygen oxidorectuctase [Marasmius tenuissimus]
MLLTFDQPNEKFFINGKSMTFPDIPVMLRIMSGVTDLSKLLPLGSVYELPLNKTIQLSFPTEDGSLVPPHPYHLHGHSFDVLNMMDIM